MKLTGNQAALLQRYGIGMNLVREAPGKCAAGLTVILPKKGLVRYGGEHGIEPTDAGRKWLAENPE